MNSSALPETEKEAYSLKSQLNDLEEKYGDFSLGKFTPSRGAREKDFGFKGQYIQKTPLEKKLDLIQKYTKYLSNYHTPEDPNDTTNVQIKYNPTQDIEFLKKRDKELELYQFDQFIDEVYKIHEPSHAKIVNELDPGYFIRKENEINRVLTVQEKLAKIKLHGIKTREDLIFMYAIFKEKIYVPRDVVFNTRRNQETKKELINKLWTPPKYSTDYTYPRIGDPLLSERGDPLYDGGDFINMLWENEENVIDTILSKYSK